MLALCIVRARRLRHKGQHVSNRSFIFSDVACMRASHATFLQLLARGVLRVGHCRVVSMVQKYHTTPLSVLFHAETLEIAVPSASGNFASGPV